jgi:hypothetical protein
MEKLIAFLKKPLVLFVIGLVLGSLVILGIRFATYSPKHTHYHANFAVYVNGEREEFKNPLYYQEVTACQTGDAPILPEQRAHMHDNVNSAVHVHDDGVTWGDFFTNLGWYVGPDFIRTRDGTMYETNGDSKLHIMLNGTDLTGGAAISRQVIGDEDKLLVSFGNISDADLQKEYKTVPATAHKLDVSKDPASCGGSEHLTVQDRLDHLF